MEAMQATRLSVKGLYQLKHLALFANSCGA